jgi:DNA-binding CsgD family transcriptional regulator
VQRNIAAAAFSIVPVAKPGMIGNHLSGWDGLPTVRWPPSVLWGHWALSRYAYDQIRSMGYEIGEIIDAASFGAASWDDVARAFTQAFPGSFAAIINTDMQNDRTNFVAADNIEPTFLASYGKYYADRNPWNRFWEGMPSGGVLISEEMAPARSFVDTEFYADWMAPQKHFDAGAGLKLPGTSQDLIYISIHFDLARHESYGNALAALYERMRGPLKRAVRLSRQIAQAQAKAAGAGALVGRFDRHAIVVDGSMTIHDANEQALDAFQIDGFLRSRRGHLMFADQDASALVRSSVRKLARNLPIERDEFLLPYGQQLWLVQLATVRVSDMQSLTSLATPQPQVLILARDLSANDTVPKIQLFAQHFRLTPAEMRFCERLAAGDSVDEAGERLSITRNTARERLKAIFAKVGVNRQAELMRRILGFG